MRIYVPPSFAKDAARERIDDTALRATIARAESGLIDAQLGFALIKQRVPRPGQGRSSGFRTIVAYVQGEIAVFLHVFAKSTKATLTKTETDDYRILAALLTRLGDDHLARLALERGWRRIDHDDLEDDVPK